MAGGCCSGAFHWCVALVSAAADKLHVSTVDLEAMPLFAVSVRIFLNAQPSLNVNRFSFLQILCGCFGLAVPKGHPKPRRLILHLAVFVLAAFICGHTKTADWRALRCVSQLRIAA